MRPDRILDILKAVSCGELSVETAYENLKKVPFQVIDDLKLDHHRTLRKGLPEIIYGEGKTFQHLKSVIDHHGAENLPLFISRIRPDMAEKLCPLCPDAVFNETAGCLRWGEFKPEWEPAGTIAVVSAGASDAPVFEEVVEILTFLSQPRFVLGDAGVAGMHRFLEHWESLSDAVVMIAVAGMEGALPSVLAGLFPGPVIGVPTSVGYGVHLGGLSPLMNMLNSCTAGVTVVNIDNGVSAGYIASLINRRR